MMSTLLRSLTWGACAILWACSGGVLAANFDHEVPVDLRGVTTRTAAIDAFRPTPEFDRHDPSNVIRHAGRYWVFYTRNVRNHQAVAVWCASSLDGCTWADVGEVLGRGTPGGWDESGAIAPYCVQHRAKFYLFYTGFRNGDLATRQLGCAVADHPQGPWRRLATNPILTQSPDGDAWDSGMLGDSNVIFRDGKWWLYFKSRRDDQSHKDTQIGVALADTITGPFRKHSSNPLFAGHAFSAWRHRDGVAALCGAVSAQILWSRDGLAFQRAGTLPNQSTGLFTPEADQDPNHLHGFDWWLDVYTENGARGLRRVDRIAATAHATPSIIDASTSHAVQSWASSDNLDTRLTPQPELHFHPSPPSGSAVIEVDDTTTYQSVLGLGSSLEHSTCYNLSLLPTEERERVIASLVDPRRGIGMNLMRICIGTSDFTPGPFYTYDDMLDGQEDPKLERFSIDRDREYVLPVLKTAKRLNPQLRFFASPWTPPPWMKTNGRYGSGSLRRECYPYFAEYLARFVEAYRREGIEIDALTVQNEPEFSPEPYPSCRWTAEQQRDFIRDHLGPLFRARQIKTRIWAFDHNFNNPSFPATILRDPQAAQHVDGSAFHLYEGKPVAMSTLHREFPDKPIYFTEGSVYGAAGAAEIISYFRNWSCSYNAWVTMIDHQGKPNISGFHDCDPTIIVLNRESLQTDYRADYYIYGQFMKFIQPGAVRIASSGSTQLPPNVALKNPDGCFVLVAANPLTEPRDLSIAWNGKFVTMTLAEKSVVTLTWRR